jgi:hypothetical protein
MKTRPSDPLTKGVRGVVTRAALSFACASAASLFLNSCAGNVPPPPAPPPTPTPATVPTTAGAETPKAFVRVTGSSLNVRSSPSSSARTVARLPRGARLERRGETGGWVQVALPDGRIGWVSDRYVTADVPCPPDSTEPEVISAPPVAFAEQSGHGRIVLEATVSSAGEVSSVSVKENTTGSADLADAAGNELRAMKFKPFVRACRTVPFVYVYTRNY